LTWPLADFLSPLGESSPFDYDCDFPRLFRSATLTIMQDLWPIVTSVFGVFLVMAVGAFCRRCDWLTREADRSLANLTANVMLPAYFMHRILDAPQFDSLSVAWIPPLFGFAATTLGFLLGLLFARFFGPLIGLDTEGKQRAFALCVGICNYGYIPLPLAEKFYPDAVIELILHNVGVDLALWSVGVAIISGSSRRGWKRALMSPPMLAVLLATLIRQFSLADHLPAAITTAIGAMGDCAIPMGLLLSGAIIVDFLRDWTWSGSAAVIASAIGIRQGLMPIVMLLAAAALSGTTEFRQVVMLQAAMPVAVFPIVLVRLYGRDTETALRVVLSTSLAGIVLIPIWLAIGSWWLGV
jgi:predicted permease